MAVRPAPTVTVVIIFLNAGAYIAEAIESVLAQTSQDFDLILVDDGSTDESSRIARAYADRHPDQVKYVEHENHVNLGMSASRNRGVAEGRGRYVSFLDADDIWLPGRLARFIEAIEAHPEAGMVYGPTLYWYSWSDTPEKEDHIGYLDLPPEQVLPHPWVLRRYLESHGGCLPGMNSLIIRREAYEAVGGFQAEFPGLYEDQVFLSKMAANYDIVVIDDVLDWYRQHPDSCCSKALEAGEYDPFGLHRPRLLYLEWLEAYLQGLNTDDAALAKALAGQLWPYRSWLGRVTYKPRRVLLPYLVYHARRLTPGGVRRSYQALKRRVLGLRDPGMANRPS